MVWRLGLERAWVKINDRLFPMESLSSTILTLKCFFIQYCTVYKLMTICFLNGVYLIVIFYLKCFAKKNVFWLFPFLFGPPYAAQADYYKSEWVGIFNRQAVFLVEMKKKRLHHKLFRECSRPRKTRPAGCGSQVGSNINGTIYLCCLTIQYLSHKYLKRCMTLKK